LSERLRALRAEVEALRASDTLHRDLYENAPNAYLLLDTEGRILRVNRRVTELLGYSAHELVGNCGKLQLVI
jgi:PAS domain-containing protein